LCLLGLTIWSGIKLFSRQYFISPLVGSLVFLAELVLFIWMWRIVSKNSWRWPSMKLTVFLLICMALVFTFAGVPPLSTYKDTLITKWEDYRTEQATQQAEIESKEAETIEAASQEQLTIEQASEEAEEEETASILKVPSGYYISDAYLGSRNLTFKGTTLTMYCESMITAEFRGLDGMVYFDFPQLGTHTYEYKLSGISAPTSLDEATEILLTDVVTEETYKVSFRYLDKYSLIVLGEDSYRKD